MASLTTTEIRLSTEIPFFNQMPAFSGFYQRMNTALGEAGITVSTEISSDNLTIKYIRTFPESKTLEFKAIFEAYVQELNTAFSQFFGAGVEELITREFDSPRTEGIYNGTITL